LALNPHSGKYFTSFVPAISRKAIKTIAMLISVRAIR